MPATAAFVDQSEVCLVVSLFFPRLRAFRGNQRRRRAPLAGCVHVSHGREPVDKGANKQQSPRRGRLMDGHLVSFPHMLGVVLNSMTLEKVEELLFEAPVPVVLHLPVDIGNDVGRP